MPSAPTRRPSTATIVLCWDSPCLCSLLYELADVGIVRHFQLVLAAFKDQPAFLQHHESSSQIALDTAAVRLQTALFRIVAKIGDEISVLITLRHHQAGSVADV